MSLPSMIQAASNSTTAVGCVRAVVVHIVICTYTWPQLCYVKPEPVTFLNNLLLLVSQTLGALLAYLNIMPQDDTETWYRTYYRTKQGNQPLTLTLCKPYHHFPSTPRKNKGVRVIHLFSLATSPYSQFDLFISMCLALGPNLLREKKRFSI